MKKILFVCHGNICRSAMAKYIMQNIVDDRGLSDMFLIDSCATSTEEIGCDMYPPARRKLKEKGIPFTKHQARQITKSDYDNFDHILLMDRNNMRNIKWIIPTDPDNKIHKLLESYDVADPWYTDDFEKAYNDIYTGCQEWLERVLND